MPHTIVSERCEGISDCIDACPVACIHPGRGTNQRGTFFYWIDPGTCIDCGICLQVCPVEGAVLAEERPDLQADATVEATVDSQGVRSPHQLRGLSWSKQRF